MKNPTALIGEDEPLLAQALQKELARAWPQLTIAAVVGDGQSVIDQTLAHTPDILFLDIQMPGMTGLQACAGLACQWSELDHLRHKAFPLIVFVTAYEHV